MKRNVLGFVVLVSLACGGVPEGSDEPVTTDSVEEPTEPSPTDPPVLEATPACPPGVEVVEMWPGEWPTPIPHVTKRIKVPARTHPCAVPDTACELEPGVYHPWSKSAGDTAYASVEPIKRYRANSATQLDALAVDEGSVVRVTRYYGEGQCEGTIDGGERQDFQCPGVGDDDFTQLETADVQRRSVFQPACGAWVDADALLTIDSVRPGEFPEYGLAAPAATER